MSENNLDNKRLYWKIAFILTIISIVLIGYLLSFIPDVLDEAYIEENFTKSIEDFVAEKSELIQYVVLTVSFPCLFIAFYKLVRKLKPKINKKVENILDAIGLTLLVCLICVICFNEKLVLERTIFKVNPIFTIIIILAQIAVIYTYYMISKNEKYKKIQKVIEYLCIGLVMAAILFVSYLYINNSYAQTEYTVHHVDAYFYPVYKILSGLTPGIDFNSIYGYYSYFYAFIMKILGTTSILSFSMIASILMLISLTCLAITANKTIKNKIIFVLVVFSYIYTLIIHICMARDGLYLQYSPQRILFPSIILAYMILYLKYKDSKHKVWFELGGFLISSLALFWNLETGAVVLLTWIFFIGYETLFFGSLKSKETYKKIGKIVLMGVSSVILYFIIINLITFIRTGMLINPKDIIFGQSIFVGSGFGMLRMKLWDPWMLLVLIYAVTLAITIRNLKFMTEKNDSNNYDKNSILFSLAILGMGLFSYYQGRSHIEVFYYVVYPAVIILGIFLDSIIKDYSKSALSEKVYKGIEILILATTLTLFSFSTIYAFFNNNGIKEMRNKKELFADNHIVRYNVELTRKIKEAVPDIEFYLPSDIYYYCYLNMPDKRNMYGYVDLFRCEDLEKIMDYLSNNDVSFCTNPKIVSYLDKKYPVEFEKMLKEKYRLYINEKLGAVILLTKANADKFDNLQGIKEFQDEKTEER